MSGSLSGLPQIPNVTLVREISRGTFGIVYLGETKGGEKVAVKTEPRICESSQLVREAFVYEVLRDCSGIPGVKGSGKTAEVRFMVFDLLGADLFQLLERNAFIFSLKTVLLIADQMLEILEQVHNRNYIHCDIKPENISIGRGPKCKRLFLYDFGFARRYRLTRTRGHVAYGKEVLAGTALYASVNTHLGIVQTRRDDLESLGYMLILFLRGDLPWLTVRSGTRKETSETIGLMKRSIKPGDLCRDLPQQFARYLKYCRGLGFEETPNYTFLRLLFKTLFQKMRFDNRSFDWEKQ